MNYQEQDYGVADPEHTEMMFNALTTTIGRLNGMESFGITPAQIYARSVLEANGLLTPAERISGNESFFGAVGGVIKNIWEVISNIFKGIFNFFFGTSDGSVSKKEDDAIKELETTAAQMKEVDARLAKNKQEYQDFLKKDRDEHSAAAVKRKEEFEAETKKWEEDKAKRKEELKNIAENAEKISLRLVALDARVTADKYNGTPFEKLYGVFHSTLGKIKPLERDAMLQFNHEITGTVKAIMVAESLAHYLRNIKESRAPLVNSKETLKSIMSSLEKRVKEGSEDSAVIATLKKDLEAGKTILKDLGELSRIIDGTCAACVSFDKMLKRSYRI